MKGVVLAGGLGSRLHPLTKVTNKHLLPVYHKPMIYYPIEALVTAGIDEILLVTGGNDAGDFLRLLGNGEAFGLQRINYAYQQGEGGIAHALSYAEQFAAGDPICVMLGDNIIERDFVEAARSFAQQQRGAKVLLKEVPDPHRFGVPVFDNGRIVAFEEKPKHPSSSYAVVGIYFYDARVFEIIRSLKPSARGELEITDVNNVYLSHHELTWSVLEGWWTDAGTFESLLLANNLVADGIAKTG
jgi:glucose-1-phosphate thymidylyltransferase